ncbi:hypothetical protein ACOMHN_002526 [Nucella lapillus]
MKEKSGGKHVCTVRAAVLVQADPSLWCGNKRCVACLTPAGPCVDAVCCATAEGQIEAIGHRNLSGLSPHRNLSGLSPHRNLSELSPRQKPVRTLTDTETCQDSHRHRNLSGFTDTSIASVATAKEAGHDGKRVMTGSGSWQEAGHDGKRVMTGSGS